MSTLIERLRGAFLEHELHRTLANTLDEAADELERQQSNADNLRQQVEDLYVRLETQGREHAAERDALREANERFGKRQEWWTERMFALENERDMLRSRCLPQALSDEQIVEMWSSSCHAANYGPTSLLIKTFARAIERAVRGQT